MYSIELSDGTKLTGLKLSGDNFMSASELTESTFSGKLRRVTITSDDADDQALTGVYEHMRLETLEHVTKVPGLEPGYYFVLKAIPAEELEKLQTAAKIEYLAMMSDIDLEE